MNEQYKQDFLHAGKLAGEVRSFGKSLICKGASYQTVISQILKKIKELGAIPAFPPQIALNEVAAHFLPQPDEDILFQDQVVKLDVGICYKGAIGDCAVTVDLSGKYQHLIDAAEEALLNAEKSIRVGMKVSEIGRVIEETIMKKGLQPVRNLAGHGLGVYQIHTSPSIPNYNDCSNAIVRPGMTFAIEPFATDGKGLIHEKGSAAIYMKIKEAKALNIATQAVWDQIQTFKGLPFSSKDLVNAGIALLDVRLGLDRLLKQGVIMGFPPLVEEAGGFVAQAENSVLVDVNGKVIVSTRM